METTTATTPSSLQGNDKPGEGEKISASEMNLLERAVELLTKQ